jgi:hypothetical protein
MLGDLQCCCWVIVVVLSCGVVGKHHNVVYRIDPNPTANQPPPLKLVMVRGISSKLVKTVVAPIRNTVQ